MIFNLPHGIVIEVVPGGGASIQSNLREDLLDDDDGDNEALLGAIEGIESLLLALAATGLDLSDPRFGDAVATTVEAVCDHLS